MGKRTKTTMMLASVGALVVASGLYAFVGQGGEGDGVAATAPPAETGAIVTVADAATATASDAAAGAGVVAGSDAAASMRPEVEVWKSPTCGCCKGWVEYLEEEGFEVTAHDTDDVDAVKARLGLSEPELKSCHTATIDGYVVEGHVPVSDIERLLAERPDVLGISAPGMPMMSPGMGSREPKGYDVVSFDENGEQALFSRH